MRYMSICAIVTISIFFQSCTNKAHELLPTQLVSVNECSNMQSTLQEDCYALMSKRNSFAQIRIGLSFYDLKKYNDAYLRFDEAYKRQNFYANALLANMYLNGYGVKKDKAKAVDLLDDVKSLDPIAAYMLAKVYIDEKKYKKAIKLLEFSANNHVKKAQKLLSDIYKNNKIVKENLQKSIFWHKKYKSNINDFQSKIYAKEYL